MKHLIFITCLLAQAKIAYCQPAKLVGSKGLELCVAATKTTSLIFPSFIRHIDRGSSNVLVQQVAGSESILLVKANAPYVGETSLSVVCANNKVYSFSVGYDSSPAALVYNIQEKVEITDSASRSGVAPGFVNSLQLSFYLNGLLFSPRNIKSTHDRGWGLKVELKGIYVVDNVIFLKVACHNTSSINYKIAELRFSIKDAVRTKRTAMQEIEVTPIGISAKPETIQAGANQAFVAAFETFTIPNRRYLSIQLRETKGGRNLQLRIPNRKLIRAEQLKHD
ncbi:conjugative transposon protein TraN [Segetibacter sp. 3557_3]|uniref:conjugative transposon protein TraN n=1 Tax=Segetibacter sp. 3557_3 TaxID=2547429 RepID=UPI0010585237|nr:conjugative transposon protein TraN [Segetibacter sp. 3557_3]TDH18046.1 conjugative transposon protein TraN [Segetibacter sp. 3557_3]